MKTCITTDRYFHYCNRDNYIVILLVLLVYYIVIIILSGSSTIIDIMHKTQSVQILMSVLMIQMVVLIHVQTLLEASFVDVYNCGYLQDIDWFTWYTEAVYSVYHT